MAYINKGNLLGEFLCGHKDCKHAAKIGSGYMCNFLIDNGYKRPCKPTKECTEYTSGKHEYKNEYTKQIPDYWGTSKNYEV